MYLRALPLSIPPQLGAGGGMPKPRKLKPASAKITEGTVIEKMIIIGAMIFGQNVLYQYFPGGRADRDRGLNVQGGF